MAVKFLWKFIRHAKSINLTVLQNFLRSSIISNLFSSLRESLPFMYNLLFQNRAGFNRILSAIFVIGYENFDEILFFRFIFRYTMH